MRYRGGRLIRGYRYSRWLVNIVITNANIPRITIDVQMSILKGENNS